MSITRVGCLLANVTLRSNEAKEYHVSRMSGQATSARLSPRGGRHKAADQKTQSTHNKTRSRKAEREQGT